MEENPKTDSYIPLELATAYLNLQKHPEAQQLLEKFIEDQPQALPAYQLLCEIYWESGAFEQAKGTGDDEVGVDLVEEHKYTAISCRQIAATSQRT